MIYLNNIVIISIMLSFFPIVFLILDHLLPEKIENNNTRGPSTLPSVCYEDIPTKDQIDFYKKASQEGNGYIRTEWGEEQIKAVKESIKMANEMQKPRTMAVIGEQKQPKTRKARRISKRTNKTPKKRTQKSKSNNKKSGKRPRV